MKRLAIIPIALALALSACGRTSPKEAPAETTTASAATTTTTAPQQEAPSATAAPGAVSPEDEEQLKDGLRALFGHKTNAQKEQEQYWSTYTVTTTDMSEYLEELKSSYTLTMDDTGLITRDGELNADLTWVIKVNGVTQLERNASGEMSYRPMNYGSGRYQIYLESYDIGGYQQVSNCIEYDTEDYGGDYAAPRELDWDTMYIMEKKNHMKHLVQSIGERGEDGSGYSVSFKMGFVCDPDHDGYLNGISFYAGKDSEGTPLTYAFDNDSSGLHYWNTDFGAQELGMWFDTAQGLDYIVCIRDGKAYDCVTGEQIKSFDRSGEYYTFTADDPDDRDHFYVSYGDRVEFETA